MHILVYAWHVLRKDSGSRLAAWQVENMAAVGHCGKVVIVANAAAEVIAGDAANGDHERSAGFYQYYQAGADDGDDAPLIV